jgi:2-dehydropantoate 2-reductase
MKVTVLGAGAVGATVGGLLKLYDPAVDVLLFGRGEHSHRLQQAGRVVLNGAWGTRSVPIHASDDVQDIAGSDYVLVTVKSQGTEEVIEKAAPYLGEAVVISLQNGINQQALGRYVRPDRLLMGITAMNMAVLEPGVVSLRRKGVTVIGPCSDDVPPDVLDAAVGVLGKARLPMFPERSILGAQYNKVLLNTMGYASVLSNSNFITEGILYRPWRRAVALPLLDEGFATLRRAEISLGRTPGLSDIFRFRNLLRVFGLPGVSPVVRLLLKRVLRPRPLIYSIYPDLIRGRKTEIEYVNGEIVRLAQQHGARAPFNALVVEMVHQLEGQADVQWFGHDEVIGRFEALR